MDKTIIDSLLQVSQITPVAGYLDPNLGGMIISAVVGVFATISLAVKGFWYKITSPLRKKKDDSSAKK